MSAPARARLTLATTSLAGCFGCHMSLLDIDVPVIAALNGHTVGGGFGLSLVCDIRIGALDAKYGANFVKLGLAPGMSISYLLPRLVGMARANELLLTGRLVDGREAESLGILNRAVPAAEVLPELTREMADLWFHCMVLLAWHGARPADVLAELGRREGTSGIAEKAARGK